MEWHDFQRSIFVTRASGQAACLPSELLIGGSIKLRWTYRHFYSIYFGLAFKRVIIVRPWSPEIHKFTNRISLTFVRTAWPVVCINVWTILIRPGIAKGSFVGLLGEEPISYDKVQYKYISQPAWVRRGGETNTPSQDTNDPDMLRPKRSFTSCRVVVLWE